MNETMRLRLPEPAARLVFRIAANTIRNCGAV